MLLQITRFFFFLRAALHSRVSVCVLAVLCLGIWFVFISYYCTNKLVWAVGISVHTTYLINTLCLADQCQEMVVLGHISFCYYLDRFPHGPILNEININRH